MARARFLGLTAVTKKSYYHNSLLIYENIAAGYDRSGRAESGTVTSWRR